MDEQDVFTDLVEFECRTCGCWWVRLYDVLEGRLLGQERSYYFHDRQLVPPPCDMAGAPRCRGCGAWVIGTLTERRRAAAGGGFTGPPGPRLPGPRLRGGAR